MAAAITRHILYLALACLAAYGSPEVLNGAEPTLRVRVMFEQEPSPELSEAFRAQAERYLRQSGIRSIWMDCTVKRAGTASSACTSDCSEAELTIHVLPRRMIGRDQALGLSYASQEGGNRALIFGPAITDLAQRLNVPLADLMALSAIHEVGHLLLGSNAHWPSGIMKPYWSAGNFDDVMRQLFHATQRKVLKEAIAKRVSPTR